MWDPKRKSTRERRRALRRQLVHSAGCLWTEHGFIGCMVRERFNYDENWPRLVDELGVSVPRSLRWIHQAMKARAAQWQVDPHQDRGMYG